MTDVSRPIRRLGLAAAGIALATAACGPEPMPSVAPTASDAARLTVTGSGAVCGPWWMGCGAVLVIEQPGWTIPAGWTPGDGDIQFDTNRRAGSEKPARITGVREPAPRWIDPGDYLLAGILTRQSDVASSPLESAIGCSTSVSIPAGTSVVRIAVEFGTACAIDVSVDGPTAAPGS